LAEQVFEQHRTALVTGCVHVGNVVANDVHIGLVTAEAGHAGEHRAKHGNALSWLELVETVEMVEKVMCFG
jgi:hypothetical protein